MFQSKHGSRTTKHSGSHSLHGTDEEVASKGGLVLLFVLLVAQPMVILDITAVNIACRAWLRICSWSGSDVSWTITSYSLIFGSLLLFGGRADLLGRRRMFLAGLGVFTASSFVSALAASAGALLRLAQDKASAQRCCRPQPSRSS